MAPAADEQLQLLEPEQGAEPAPRRASRHPWAWLLRRVFGAELEECARCGGRMRLVGVVDTGRARACQAVRESQGFPAGTRFASMRA